MQKKTKKNKKVNPAVLTGGNGKKKFKKKVQSRQPVTVGHVSAPHSFPPFETVGMEKDKKKKPKMKVGHFGNFFSKGFRLEIFFANRVRKKKILLSMHVPMISLVIIINKYVF